MRIGNRLRARNVSAVGLAISALKKFGSNAHIYQPGVGVTQGITAYNYASNTGAANPDAVVDSTVGLMLDNGSTPGQLGSELAPQTSSFSSTTGFSASNGSTLSIVGGNLVVTSTASGNTILSFGGNAVSGTTYQHTTALTNPGGYAHTWYIGGANGTAGSVSTAETVTNIVTANSTQAVFQLLIVFSAAAQTFTINSVTCKPCYGIPASQPTAGSRPTLRRGYPAVNQKSQDFSAWSSTAAGTLTTGQADPLGGTNATLFSGANKNLYEGAGLVVASAIGTVFTQSIWCYSATAGTIVIGSANTGGLTSSISIASGWGLYAYSWTSSTVNDGPSIFLTGTLSSITIFRSGLHIGNVPAATILANGGIPLTTTTAASQSAGAWWAEFTSSSSQQLTLASVPFQLAEDHAVVAVAVAKTNANHTVFEVGPGTNTSPRVCSIRNNSGTINTIWSDGTTSNQANAATTVGIGVPYVVSARKVSNSCVTRLNGVAGTPVTTALNATTSTSAVIGNRNAAVPGEYMNGTIGQVIVIKGTVSDTDLLTIERALGQQYGITTA